eukprot:3115739-Prorocentrum_lima.AAC.1
MHTTGLHTTDTSKCPLDEVTVIGTARVNAVKGKQQYWVEPSCLAAYPEQTSGTLRWGFPGG